MGRCYAALSATSSSFSLSYADLAEGGLFAASVLVSLCLFEKEMGRFASSPVAAAAPRRVALYCVLVALLFALADTLFAESTEAVLFHVAVLAVKRALAVASSVLGLLFVSQQLAARPAAAPARSSSCTSLRAAVAASVVLALIRGGATVASWTWCGRGWDVLCARNQGPDAVVIGPVGDSRDLSLLHVAFGSFIAAVAGACLAFWLRNPVTRSRLSASPIAFALLLTASWAADAAGSGLARDGIDAGHCVRAAGSGAFALLFAPVAYSACLAAAREAIATHKRQRRGPGASPHSAPGHGLAQSRANALRAGLLDHAHAQGYVYGAPDAAQGSEASSHAPSLVRSESQPIPGRGTPSTAGGGCSQCGPAPLESKEGSPVPVGMGGPLDTAESGLGMGFASSGDSLPTSAHARTRRTRSAITPRTSRPADVRSTVAAASSGSGSGDVGVGAGADSGDRGGGCSLMDASERRGLAAQGPAQSHALPPSTPLSAYDGGGAGRRGGRVDGRASMGPRERPRHPPSPAASAAGAAGGSASVSMRAEVRPLSSQGRYTLGDVGAGGDEAYQLPHVDVMIDSQQIEFERHIGHGGGGIVELYQWQGRPVVVKQLQLTLITSDYVQSFRDEAGVLRDLHHPNVISFLGVVFIRPRLGIVMEYCELGSLDDVLCEGLPRDEPRAHPLRLARGIARGMAYLHSRKIVHRDLKSSNILVDAQWTPKVGDLGDSRRVSSHGTPAFQAPETLSETPIALRADVHSYGMVLWQLLTWRDPYVLVTRDEFFTLRETRKEAQVRAVDEEEADHGSSSSRRESDTSVEAMMPNTPPRGSGDAAEPAVEPAARPAAVEERHFQVPLETRHDVRLCVGKFQLRPPPPEGCHPTLLSLLSACWHQHPEQRPSFDTIARKLRRLEEEVPMDAFPFHTPAGRHASLDDE